MKYGNFTYWDGFGAKKAKPAKDWLAAYANASLETIGRDNFLEFVS